MRLTDLNGTKLPLMGFGAMRLPTYTDGKKRGVDIETLSDMVDLAIAAGVNYFDTSIMYHGGSSETSLKKALVERYPRDRFMVADKMPPWSVRRQSDYQRLFDEELKNLGVDYFDFYLMHSLDLARARETEELGGFEFMEKIKRSGKAKHIGFSFHDSAETLGMILFAHPEMEFAQLQINYIDWYTGVAKDWYDTARKHGKPIMVMEPVKGGTLADLPLEVTQIFEYSRPGMSAASWAMRFAASLEGVVTVLSGVSSVAQITDNISYMREFEPYTEADYKTIEMAVEKLRGVSYIPCTGCKYCSECPQGIAIDQIISIYNQYKRTGNKWPLQQMYGCLDKRSRVDRCTYCGACKEHCPQHIDVPNVLKEVGSALSK